LRTVALREKADFLQNAVLEAADVARVDPLAVIVTLMPTISQPRLRVKMLSHDAPLDVDVEVEEGDVEDSPEVTEDHDLHETLTLITKEE